MWPIRVYYEDTDAGGIVYYGRYLNFFERARTEWLRAIGLEQHKLAKEMGVLFVVRKAEIDYLNSAHLDDKISIYLQISELRRVSITFAQTAYREIDNIQLAKAKIQIACLNIATGRPHHIPEQILKASRHEP